MQLAASGKSKLGPKFLQGPRLQTDATRIPSKSAQIAGSEPGRARECKPSKVKNEERAVPHEGKLLANGGCVGPAQRGGLFNISGSPA